MTIRRQLKIFFLVMSENYLILKIIKIFFLPFFLLFW